MGHINWRFKRPLRSHCGLSTHAFKQTCPKKMCQVSPKGVLIKARWHANKATRLANLVQNSTLFDKVPFFHSLKSSSICSTPPTLPIFKALTSKSLSHTPPHRSTNMAGGKKLIARCHQHKWCNKKGCYYRPKLQPILEDGEFKPRGLILVKLPSQRQCQATESRKRKHHTILSTFSEKYRYAKMNKLSDAWTQ
jgi:hypothetical protein